ncbi:hypothetical protein Pcinc_035170 [Petrolisthes cinctipes]|uniref:HTH CENPB-type domain-containing protein n=1 Tax=Petrolisthes cinctipes TaxID=88211 RepID=A0AAE1C0D7_PETCI|nr:hypothetical protein Pcinc_035170 [Petrolisthes cinctipes]
MSAQPLGSDHRRTANMETSKKKVPVKRDSRVGKKLNRYSLQDKTKVIELIEKGLKNAEIVRQTGFPEGTVRNFKKQKEAIKASLKVASKLFTGNVQASQRLLTNYSSTNRLIAVMEFYLKRWIEGRFKSKGSINGPQIRNQALLLYNAICKKKNIKYAPPFSASVGWFAKFKKRFSIKLVIYQGKVSSADEATAESFPVLAQQYIKDGGYTLDQVYNCEETGLYWKRSPSSTFIHKTEKQAPDIKMAKDRIGILFTCNATGTHRMKPLIIYKFKKPRAYKGADMNELDDIYWASNPKGYMNMLLSAEWFDKHFVPDALRKCKELNLDGKVLLFMENAHYLVGRHPSVQVEFLPPNTISRIQPLDHELIANVKLLYYKRVYDEMREAIDRQEELKAKEEMSDEEELMIGPKPVASGASPPKPLQWTASPKTTAKPIISVKQFWRNFDVKTAVDYMTDAWKSITTDTIKHAWHPLLPDLIPPCSKQQHKDKLLREAVEAARHIPAPGFDKVDEALVLEMMHPQETITAEEIVEDGELEMEVEEEENRKENKLTAGYLSRKITDLTEMEEFMRCTSDTQCLEKLLPMLQKLNQELRDIYVKKVNDRRQTVITKYLNKRNELQEIMENLDENDGQETVSDGEEDIVNILSDIPYDFDGFFVKEKSADEKITKLRAASRDAADSEREDGGGTGGSEGAACDK